MKGAYIVNGPRVSLLNGFLSFMYRTPLSLLLLVFFTAILLLSLVYAGLLSSEPEGCGPPGIHLLYCQQHLQLLQDMFALPRKSSGKDQSLSLNEVFINCGKATPRHSGVFFCLALHICSAGSRLHLQKHQLAA